MAQARETWTDERLDDLSRRVDEGFERIDRELHATRIELGAHMDHQAAELSRRINAQGVALSERIDAQGSRIDALQRTMMQVGGGIGAGVVATLASVLATRA